jgi:hypothetical protein
MRQPSGIVGIHYHHAQQKLKTFHEKFQTCRKAYSHLMNLPLSPAFKPGIFISGKKKSILE